MNRGEVEHLCVVQQIRDVAVKQCGKEYKRRQAALPFLNIKPVKIDESLESILGKEIFLLSVEF